jgi:plasmid stabilization system protein ParE
LKKYKLVIDVEALRDIQEATDWYNQQSNGLGSRFQKQVKSQINNLKSYPGSYTIRYADVHCMLIKKIPFLVHFTVDNTEALVEVFAVIHTSRNPKIWEQKRK